MYKSPLEQERNAEPFLHLQDHPRDHRQLIVDIKLQSKMLLQRRQYERVTDKVLSRMNTTAVETEEEEMHEVVRISDSIESKIREALSLNLDERPRILQSNGCKFSYLWLIVVMFVAGICFLTQLAASCYCCYRKQSPSRRTSSKYGHSHCRFVGMERPLQNCCC